MPFRITVDTGGTFTDVVVSDEDGRFFLGKSLTTPKRSFDGMRAALAVVAEDIGISCEELLARSEMLIFGTTRATNAIVTRNTAKTAFLTTEGFPDILVLKEGGKYDPHDFTQPYPDPYIPRRQTFEIPGRINAEGEIDTPLDVEATKRVLETLKSDGYEAVAVCLIWSIANPDHELQVGRLIEEILPEIPFTLSHQLIPILREYRRASTTAIDASLKPLMRRYLSEMEEDLRAAGFAGELFVSTSVGGCMSVKEIAERPVHTVKSGPAMAPVAGAVYADVETMGADLLVCDSGGTTFDVGLVREGELVFTRETWLGRQWIGDLVGMSTVDVRSVGAGGGSIAWVDSGGLLRVGPQSAGSTPGPVCYGGGGTEPTVTDAAVVLGYIDPNYFVGGRMTLDIKAAEAAVEKLGKRIGKGRDETAFGIMLIANELMIRAIQEITVIEGIDPRESVIVAGGGAAGLNIFPIANELGCEHVLLPKTASALSACGMQFADIIAEQSASFAVRSDTFPVEAVNALFDRMLADLQGAGESHIEPDASVEISFFVEARYEFQVWDLEIPVPGISFKSKGDLEALCEVFHTAHQRVFAVRDEDSVIEFINWKARVTRVLDKPMPNARADKTTKLEPESTRLAYFGDGKRVATPVYKNPQPGQTCEIVGPAVLELPTTTLVVYPGMQATLTEFGNFKLTSFGAPNS